MTFFRNSAPILIHVHVPRTAGTSLNQILRESFGKRHVELYFSDPQFVLPPEELDRIVASKAGVASISSHSIRVYRPWLAGRKALYISLLREPVDRFLSNMSFIRKHYRSLDPAHRRNCPPNAHELSVREIAAWCLARGGELNRLGNATHFLAGAQRVHGSHVREYEASLADFARRVLDGFFFVGLTERFEEGLRVLARRLHEHGHTLKLRPCRSNTSRDALGDCGWVRAEDPVGKQVLDYVAVDRPLYRYACARFSRELQQAQDV